MSNIRLFFSKSLSLNLIDKLDKSQSHYLSKVMRLKINENFSLFNNHRYSSNDIIIEIFKKDNQFKITSSIPKDFTDYLKFKDIKFNSKII